jgi:putative transposase
MRIRRLNHSVYQTEYHIVWGTLYRRHFLKQYVREAFIEGLRRIQRDYPTWYFLKVNTGDDHVHLLMEIPLKYAIVEVVQKLKARTSIYLQDRFRFIRAMYPDGSIWSTGYFVSTVGLNEENIKKYIARQNQYDRGTDETGEFS